MLDVEFAQLSDAGCVREHNEDSLGSFVPQSPVDATGLGWLFAVADGVGGQDRGEVASSLAIESLIADFQGAVRGEPLTTLLSRLVQKANTRIFETRMNTGPGGSSMATTVVACALRYDRAVIAHVGDSRCYLIRQGYAASLTRDHTFSNEQVRLGLITTREAAKAHTANVLSRALGTDMFVSVETSEQQVLADDVLVLCSDGLHHSINADDLARVAGRGAPLEEAAHALVSLAKERDGKDNITVQLIKVRGVERVGMYRGRHYKLQQY